MSSQCRGPDGEPLPPATSGSDPVVAVRGFPAWTPNVRDFDEIGEVTLAAAPATDWTIVARYVVPQGCEATWLWFGTNLDARCDYATIQWRLRVNGDVRLLYPSIAPVADLLPDMLRPVYICGAGGQEFVLEALNEAAATSLVRGCVKGLYRPAMYHRT